MRTSRNEGGDRAAIEPTDAVARRFWRRVGRHDQPDNCWLWLMARSGAELTTRYGSMSIGWRQAAAHRVSWVLNIGPIPPGQDVLHQCDNPPCVNPSHLFLGTNRDNIADKMAKGRQSRLPGESNGYAKLSADQVRAIRSSGAGYRATARAYGVTRECIMAIRKRWTWRDLP